MVPGIVLLGLVFTAVFVFISSHLQGEDPLVPTITVTGEAVQESTPAQAGVISPEPSSIPTEVYTPTANLVPSRTPHPSPTTLPDGWLFFDDFEGNPYRYKKIDFKGVYEIVQLDNNNIMKVNSTSFGDSNGGMLGIVPEQYFDNYAVEFEMMLTSTPKTCQDCYWSGLGILLISNTGTANFSCNWWFKNGGISIGSNQRGSINTDPNVVNRIAIGNRWYKIRVEQKGDELTLYIDGSLYRHREDLVIPGETTPYITFGDNLDFTLYIDNLLIESIE